MRARYKGPSGTGIVEVADDATVRDLFDDLCQRTGIQKFTLKYGPPMAMKTLSLDMGNELARSLGLHGETLTIVPEAARQTSPAGDAPDKNEALASDQSMLQQPQARINEDPADITIPWAEREGTILLRVMPSDNSCLFTAFGGTLPSQIPAQRLRQMMADYIDQHADVYTEAVLGSPPSHYRHSIQDPDRWGGGIELSILSAIFDIQICTYDVQAQNLMRFGEEQRERCILVYSGIHYDRVAFTYSEYPHKVASLPPEMDRTIWPTDDNEVLDKALSLVVKLNAAHYYTDTEGLILKCDVSGCDWIGSGQLDGRRHAEETGHVEMSEVRDEEEDNVLRKCNVPSCGFMGQGEKMTRQHRLDTGHETFSVIPDW